MHACLGQTAALVRFSSVDEAGTSMEGDLAPLRSPENGVVRKAFIHSNMRTGKLQKSDASQGGFVSLILDLWMPGDLVGSEPGWQHPSRAELADHRQAPSVLCEQGCCKCSLPSS